MTQMWSTEEITVLIDVLVAQDEKNQILTTNCWITQIWNDHHLRWNVSEFAGISVVRIPYQKVWLPDTILYNNADPQYQSAVINTNVIVRHTGQVIWLSHGIFRSSCDISVEYFPFDVQSCHLKWASWTYDGYQVELESQTEEGDVSNYQANGEFDLISFTASKHTEYYSCCSEPYPDITYVIVLKRRPMFYVCNLILPCALINSIALLVFYVPSESGEKVTLGISAVLSMTVFLMTIRETLPPTEKTPLISLYYGVSICLVSFASGLSVVTLNIYHRGVRNYPVPTSIRNIVLGTVAKIVFIRFEAVEYKYHKSINTCTGIPIDFISNEYGDYSNSRQRLPRQHIYNRPRDQPMDTFEWHFMRALNNINATIEKNETRLSEQERRDLIDLEWKQVSLVLDRLLLYIFALITIITTVCILYGNPPDTMDN